MSGIYISGAGMPKSCWTCFARRDVDIGVGIADGCDLLKTMIYNPEERLDGCPLIPVPDHGRLGDLDELATIHRKGADRGDSAWKFHVTAKAWVDEMPTIIPADKEIENG